MAVITQPTSPRLLPEVVRDPRVEPAVRPGGVTILEAPRPSGDCDCAPKSVPGGATPDLTDRIAAYLKARFEPITPLGPPPDDRRLLAEAGVELAQFMTYPPGISPMGRSALITPSVEPFRSPRSPEVLRALSNQLSLAQAMPKGITSLSTLFGRKASEESKSEGESKSKGKPGPSVPPAAWAGYADAVAATVVNNVFPSPLGRLDGSVLPALTVCRCEKPSSRTEKKTGG